MTVESIFGRIAEQEERERAMRVEEELRESRWGRAARIEAARERADRRRREPNRIGVGYAEQLAIWTV